MTYRDPYSDRVSNPDPTYTAAPRSRGGIVGAIVAIVVVAAIIAYGTNRTSTNTATGPNTTMSQSSTAAAHPPELLRG
jgi:hypothetical protein